MILMLHAAKFAKLMMIAAAVAEYEKKRDTKKLEHQKRSLRRRLAKRNHTHRLAVIPTKGSQRFSIGWWID